MESKNSITLEYFANYIHYGVYRLHLGLNYRYLKFNKMVANKLFHITISEDRIKRNNHFMCNYEDGLIVSITHHNFGFCWSGYACFFSFILMGVLNRIGLELEGIMDFIVFAIPVCIGYIPQHIYVFKGDRYIKFFNKFDKKGPEWQRKCKWAALAFIIFDFPVMFLGLFIMDFIIKKL